MLTKGMFLGGHIPLQDADVIAAAKKLRVEPAVVQTVVAVETSGSPFDPDGRPKILFEAHLFGRHTGHRYEGRKDPHGKAISSRVWDRTLYNGAREWQYVRMFTAFDLDPVAAVKSTSFGAFQILGQEYETAGFSKLEEFVLAMASSAGKHLDAFTNYVLSRKLDDELRSKDWANFARQYNGSGYKANRYDEKMATEYRRLVAKWAAKVQASKANNPEPHEMLPYELSRKTVAALQAALNAMPVPPRPLLQVDGYVGEKTTGAVLDFEALVGLPADCGIIDNTLLDKLGILAEAA